VWWPTDDTAGPEARYWLGAVAAGPGVYADASVADGAHRVVVFSHGHQGYAENSSFLAEHLASWGFVVVAPDHTGNTTLDGSDRTTDIYALRPGDVAAALDWALDPADAVRAAVDPADPVLLGHSFGGYTALAALGAHYDPAVLADCPNHRDDPYCSTLDADWTARFEAGFADPRWAAGVVMAPGDFDLFGAAGLAAVQPPVLLMGGGLDPGGDASNFWAALQDPHSDRWLRIDGAGHQTFTDFSGILEDFDGLIDPTAGFRVIDAYALAAVLAAGGDTTVDPLLSTFPGPFPGAALAGSAPGSG
jgi:predicted dienelactone hydrolase